MRLINFDGPHQNRLNLNTALAHRSARAPLYTLEPPPFQPKPVGFCGRQCGMHGGPGQNREGSRGAVRDGAESLAHGGTGGLHQ